jgi:hypothetical protein
MEDETMSRLKPNWGRVYGALAVVATALLAAGGLLSGEASGRIRASLQSGEEWSARLDRYERLGVLAGAVSEQVRRVVWSSDPDAERPRLKAALEAFEVAHADAVGELRLAPPTAATNALLLELHEIDGAVTEVAAQAETVFSKKLAESGVEEPELAVVLDALSSGFASVGTQVRAMQERDFSAGRTAADSRRLAEQVLAFAALFLILGALCYGSRRIGRPGAAASPA